MALGIKSLKLYICFDPKILILVSEQIFLTIARLIGEYMIGNIEISLYPQIED